MTEDDMLNTAQNVTQTLQFACSDHGDAVALLVGMMLSVQRETVEECARAIIDRRKDDTCTCPECILIDQLVDVVRDLATPGHGILEDRIETQEGPARAAKSHKLAKGGGE